MRRLSLLAALLVLGASGCRPLALREDPFGVPAPLARQVYAVDWWVQLVPHRMWEASPMELARPALDPASGRLIVLTRDGKVRSVGEGGTVAWSQQTGGRFIAGATVHEGTVYVPGGDGTLYALAADTGEPRWSYAAGEELATPPLVHEGRVFVTSQVGTLFAVDAASGEWLWQYRRERPAGFTIHGASEPVAGLGAVFLGFADGAVVALEPEDGSVRWEKRLASSGEFLDVNTRPVLDEAGRLYVASYREGVFALDAGTGDIQWTTTAGGITDLIAAGEVVFGSGAERISAFHSETGRQIWSQRLPGRAGREPLLARGHLVVPVDEALVFFDPATGRRKLTWDPGEGVSASPLWSGAHLYVLSNRGFLYALRLGGRAG